MTVIILAWTLRDFFQLPDGPKYKAQPKKAIFCTRLNGLEADPRQTDVDREFIIHEFNSAASFKFYIIGAKQVS